MPTLYALVCLVRNRAAWTLEAVHETQREMLHKPQLVYIRFASRQGAFLPLPLGGQVFSGRQRCRYGYGIRRASPLRGTGGLSCFFDKNSRGPCAFLGLVAAPGRAGHFPTAGPQERGLIRLQSAARGCWFQRSFSNVISLELLRIFLTSRQYYWLDTRPLDDFNSIDGYGEHHSRRRTPAAAVYHTARLSYWPEATCHRT